MRQPVLISVGVHAALIAGFAGWSIERRLSEPSDGGSGSAPAVGLVAPVDIVPIDIALVTLSDGPSDQGDVESGPVARGASIVAIAGKPGAVTIGSSEGKAAVPERNGTMRMRSGGGVDLRLPGDAMARIVDKPGEPYFAPKHHKLQPNGANGHVIRDLVTTVTIHKDGTVKFKDKPDFTFRFVLPFSKIDFEDLQRRAKQEFVAWVADPYKDQRPINTDEVPRACMMHDDVCYTGPADSEGGGIVGGKAGLTEALHRKFVGDPFASRKLKLLDDTRDARVHIGAQHRAEQLDRSAVLMQRNVAAVWQTITDPVQRKQALFTLWDECVEGEGPTGQAGENARAIVMGSIRGKLPAGSPGGFTVDEIAKLDAARTSRQHFAPY